MCLGHGWFGRFGNHLFQLMFLVTMHGHTPPSPPVVHRVWDNYHTLTLSALYPVQDCPTDVLLNDGRTRITPAVVRIREDANLQWEEWAYTHPNANLNVTGGNVPLEQFVAYYDGFFQLPMPGYDREAVLTLMQPRPHVYREMLQLWYAMLAGLHAAGGPARAAARQHGQGGRHVPTHPVRLVPPHAAARADQHVHDDGRMMMMLTEKPHKTTETTVGGGSSSRQYL